MVAGSKQKRPNKTYELGSKGKELMGQNDMWDGWAYWIANCYESDCDVRIDWCCCGGCRSLVGHHGNGCVGHHDGYECHDAQNFLNFPMVMEA